MYLSVPAHLVSIAEQTLEDLLEQFPMKNRPVLEWRNYPVTAGRAYLDDNVICLSAILMTNVERVRDTLVHEFAHLVVNERHGRTRPHGAEWRAVMAKLGGDPSITHDYPCEHKTQQPRYACTCERCSEEVLRVRPFRRNYDYYHARCGGRFKQRNIKR